MGSDVRPLTDNERALLEKLASAGRPTEVDGDDLILGQTLPGLKVKFSAAR